MLVKAYNGPNLLVAHVHMLKSLRASVNLILNNLSRKSTQLIILCHLGMPLFLDALSVTRLFWIKINQYNKQIREIIPPVLLLERWKKEKAYLHNIMPMIEAAHIGPITVSTFSLIYRVGINDDDNDFIEAITKEK